jgi:hypothetical protein
MRQSYKNAALITAIFLLALLMQFLRQESLYLTEVLSLGFMYAIGLVAAALVGKSTVVQSR